MTHASASASIAVLWWEGGMAWVACHGTRWIGYYDRPDGKQVRSPAGTRERAAAWILARLVLG